MITTLWQDAFQPFSLALLAVFGLLVLEVITLLIGKSLSALTESLLTLEGPDAGGFGGSVFDWLNPSGVPILIWLTMLGTAFGLIGVGGQGALTALGLPVLPALAAVPAALFLSLPLTRAGCRLIARWIPQIETYALEEASLVGQPAQVVMGPVRADAIAKVRITDASGNVHFPKVQPSDPADVIPEGEWVVIVAADSAVLKVVRATLPPRHPDAS
jgi:hypothetical protein